VKKEKNWNGWKEQISLLEQLHRLLTGTCLAFRYVALALALGLVASALALALGVVALLTLLHVLQ